MGTVRFREKRMAILTFSGLDGAAEIQINIAAPIRITGGAIASAGGTILAVYSKRGWRVGEFHFDSLTFREAVRIHIHGDTGEKSFGPFEHVTLADHMICTPRGTLARYDALDESWRFDNQGSLTQVLVLEPYVAA
jgi:hypothetical protein